MPLSRPPCPLWSLLLLPGPSPQVHSFYNKMRWLSHRKRFDVYSRARALFMAVQERESASLRRRQLTGDAVPVMATGSVDVRAQAAGICEHFGIRLPGPNRGKFSGGSGESKRGGGGANGERGGEGDQGGDFKNDGEDASAALLDLLDGPNGMSDEDVELHADRALEVVFARIMKALVRADIFPAYDSSADPSHVSSSTPAGARGITPAPVSPTRSPTRPPRRVGSPSTPGGGRAGSSMGSHPERLRAEVAGQGGAEQVHTDTRCCLCCLHSPLLSSRVGSACTSFYPVLLP